MDRLKGKHLYEYSYLCPICQKSHIYVWMKMDLEVGKVCKCLQCPKTSEYFVLVYNALECLACAQVCGNIKAVLKLV